MSSRTYIDVLTTNVLLTAAVVAHRFVTGAGAYPAAAAAAVGVSRADGAIGEINPVQVLGEIYVETGGAIAVNAAIETDASGRAITLAAGVKLARMAPGQVAATAAGQFVRVIQIPN